MTQSGSGVREVTGPHPSPSGSPQAPFPPQTLGSAPSQAPPPPRAPDPFVPKHKGLGTKPWVLLTQHPPVQTDKGAPGGGGPCKAPDASAGFFRGCKGEAAAGRTGDGGYGTWDGMGSRCLAPPPSWKTKADSGEKGWAGRAPSQSGGIPGRSWGILHDPSSPHRATQASAVLAAGVAWDPPGWGIWGLAGAHPSCLSSPSSPAARQVPGHSASAKSTPCR